jgi:hypothetical protein
VWAHHESFTPVPSSRHGSTRSSGTSSIRGCKKGRG